jgi:hypothetical protein
MVLMSFENSPISVSIKNAWGTQIWMCHQHSKEKGVLDRGVGVAC